MFNCQPLSGKEPMLHEIEVEIKSIQVLEWKRSKVLLNIFVKLFVSELEGWKHAN